MIYKSSYITSRWHLKSCLKSLHLCAIVGRTQAVAGRSEGRCLPENPLSTQKCTVWVPWVLTEYQLRTHLQPTENPTEHPLRAAFLLLFFFKFFASFFGNYSCQLYEKCSFLESPLRTHWEPNRSFPRETRGHLLVICDWTELNWTEVWTFRLVELELWTFIELNWTFWTELHACANCYCMWTGVGLNCELLIEKHVKVIFCGEEYVKKNWGDFFARFHPDCWVQTQNLENEFRYVKFSIDEKKRWTGLEKVWFSWTEVIFKTVYSSVQFSSQFTWTVAKFNSSWQLGGTSSLRPLQSYK